MIIEYKVSAAQTVWSRVLTRLKNWRVSIKHKMYLVQKPENNHFFSAVN
jgi:hypothetical protein